MSMGAHGIVRPWRRRVDFDAVRAGPPSPTSPPSCYLTQQPNWGYQLRRGLVSLPVEDFRCCGVRWLSVDGSVSRKVAMRVRASWS